jgi:hypothetical protein
MEEIQIIEERREQILKEIREIRAMRKGSIYEQYLKVKQKGQEEPVLRGPYLLYTRKERGKTVGERLSQARAKKFRAEIKAFNRFRDLCDEYAKLTERLGELERELGDESREKKQPKSRWKKTRK